MLLSEYQNCCNVGNGFEVACVSKHVAHPVTFLHLRYVRNIHVANDLGDLDQRRCSSVRYLKRAKSLYEDVLSVFQDSLSYYSFYTFHVSKSFTFVGCVGVEPMSAKSDIRKISYQARQCAHTPSWQLNRTAAEFL